MNNDNIYRVVLDIYESINSYHCYHAAVLMSKYMHNK